MRSRMRTILTALAAMGLLAVALIGCQPAASPDESVIESISPSFPIEPSASPS